MAELCFVKINFIGVGGWVVGWLVGWMVGESGNKANSAQLGWSLAELGKNLTFYKWICSEKPPARSTFSGGSSILGL